MPSPSKYTSLLCRMRPHAWSHKAVTHSGSRKAVTLARVVHEAGLGSGVGGPQRHQPLAFKSANRTASGGRLGQAGAGWEKPGQVGTSRGRSGQAGTGPGKPDKLEQAGASWGGSGQVQASWGKPGQAGAGWDRLGQAG
eukprot:365876-Chlamydomonas_euryale.AAC.1